MVSKGAMDLKHREEDLAGRGGLSLAVNAALVESYAHLLDPPPPWREDPTPHFPLIMNLCASKEG